VIELFAFEDAPKAHERMLSGDAHFRVVFDIATSGRRTRNPIARHKLRLWTTTQHQEWLQNHAAAPLRRSQDVHQRRRYRQHRDRRICFHRV